MQEAKSYDESKRGNRMESNKKNNCLSTGRASTLTTVSACYSTCTLVGLFIGHMRTSLLATTEPQECYEHYTINSNRTRLICTFVNIFYISYPRTSKKSEMLFQSSNPCSQSSQSLYSSSNGMLYTTVSSCPFLGYKNLLLFGLPKLEKGS